MEEKKKRLNGYPTSPHSKELGLTKNVVKKQKREREKKK